MMKRRSVSRFFACSFQYVVQVIRSCGKLAYGTAQAVIDEPERVWAGNEEPIWPRIWGGFSAQDIAKDLLELNRIANELRRRRFEGGALRLDKIKLSISTDRTTHLPTGFHMQFQRDSNRMIEEFMLLANISTAEYIAEHARSRALLRQHNPPREHSLRSAIEELEAAGVPMDGSSSGALQRSLDELRGSSSFDPTARMEADLKAAINGDREVRMRLFRLWAVMALMTRPMLRAAYVCGDDVIDMHELGHFALHVPLYTHFTSPIRRYADVMVHRLLAELLGTERHVGVESNHRSLVSFAHQERARMRRLLLTSARILRPIAICGTAMPSRPKR
jgi:DIS3-like exonuclease 2